jgi:GNAT superfamily N-acetyltransferase
MRATLIFSWGGRIEVRFETIDQWDEKLWEKIKVIYFEAFGKSGAKPEKIIRNMFAKNLCFLHVAFEGEEVMAMSLTGKLQETNTLLIDYLAVRENKRNHGIGQKLLNYIKKWCISEKHNNSILIEVESEQTEENLKRIQFWKKNQFKLTKYVHHYIWVPEPYQAMYVKLTPDANIPTQGEVLFQWIVHFHKESFNMKK